MNRPERLSRRQLLRTIGGGFGGLALNKLLAEAAPLGGPPGPHFPPRAKRVIFLFFNGGPSQVDTFDYKPALKKYHGQPMPGEKPKTERETGNLLASPFEFRQYGDSGLWISDLFSGVGQFADDLCIIRSMHTDRPFHDAGFFLMNCGHVQAGRPSMGSWLTYGLGVENEDLPGFIVLCPGLPTVGPQLWSSSFLPGVHQGTHLDNSSADPFEMAPNLRSESATLGEQRSQLDLLGRLNQIHESRIGEDAQLDTAIRSMEIAFQMQTEASDALDVSKETEAVRERYGDGDFARGCLIARRLVERGVRVVQAYTGPGQPWDHHDDIMDHRKLAAEADRAIAALLADLKTIGLFDETLVIIGGEFGRTPAAEVSGLVKVQNGRDHNNQGFSMVLAGGGVRGGTTYGATDDLGYRAVENPVHVHDLHATILHILGLDHTRLTYRYSGRDFRLTDVAGNVIHDILA